MAYFIDFSHLQTTNSPIGYRSLSWSDEKSTNRKTSPNFLYQITSRVDTDFFFRLGIFLLVPIVHCCVLGLWSVGPRGWWVRSYFFLEFREALGPEREQPRADQRRHRGTTASVAVKRASHAVPALARTALCGRVLLSIVLTEELLLMVLHRANCSKPFRDSAPVPQVSTKNYRASMH